MPWRPEAGICPQLSDAEPVTLAVMQALLGFTSEARGVRYAHDNLRHLYPYLPAAARVQQAAAPGRDLHPALHPRPGRQHHAMD